MSPFSCSCAPCFCRSLPAILLLLQLLAPCPHTHAPQVEHFSRYGLLPEVESEEEEEEVAAAGAPAGVAAGGRPATMCVLR